MFPPFFWSLTDLFKSLSPSLHHDLGLLDEVLLVHGSLSDGLDGHFVLSPPLPEPHQTELTAAQLLHEGQLAGVDLPFLCREGNRRKKRKEEGRYSTDRRERNTCDAAFQTTLNSNSDLHRE